MIQGNVVLLLAGRDRRFQNPQSDLATEGSFNEMLMRENSSDQSPKIITQGKLSRFEDFLGQPSEGCTVSVQHCSNLLLLLHPTHLYFSLDLRTIGTMLYESIPFDKKTSIKVLIDSENSDQSASIDSKVGVILAHGASGNAESGNMPHYSNFFVNAGFPCIRFTSRSQLAGRVKMFKAIMEYGPHLPGFAKVDRWIVSGHSMGARVACQVASEMQSKVAAVVLFSYPLHPPGKPTALRIVPLIDLELPLFFVRGSKDPFSQSTQWESTVKKLKSKNVVIENMKNAGHSLHTDAMDAIYDSLARFLHSTTAVSKAGVKRKR